MEISSPNAAWQVERNAAINTSKKRFRESIVYRSFTTISDGDPIRM
jgi:hypothetical protein